MPDSKSFAIQSNSNHLFKQSLVSDFGKLGERFWLFEKESLTSYVLLLKLLTCTTFLCKDWWRRQALFNNQVREPLNCRPFNIFKWPKYHGGPFNQIFIVRVVVMFSFKWPKYPQLKEKMNLITLLLIIFCREGFLFLDFSSLPSSSSSSCMRCGAFLTI